MNQACCPLLRHSFYVTLVLLLTLPCPSSLAQSKPLAVLPFQLKADHRIYLQCQVNESDTLLFLFDTGAAPMVINQSLLGDKLRMTFQDTVRNNGTNGVNYIASSKNNRLAFGGLWLDSVRFVSIPYGKNAPFDGVFGSEVMKRYVIEINYKTRTIAFYDRKTYSNPLQEYTRLRLRFILGVPVARCSLHFGRNTYRGWFEFDSGSDNSLILAQSVWKPYNLSSTFKRVATAGITGSDGAQVEAPIIVIPEINFRDKHFYRFPLLLSPATTGVIATKGISGIIGNSFLKRFDQVLDLAADQIYLRPNNLVNTPYYDFLAK